VLSFVRRNANDRVFVVLNLSDQQATVGFSELLFHGQWRDFFADAVVELAEDLTMDLAPWSYRVFVGAE
jgi:hypothetical protein